MPTQIQRREATRARLIEAARKLFVRQGYEATSTEAILADAGTSRGAFYHHFPTKLDLMAAVYEQVAIAAIDRASARRKDGETPLDALLRGCLAWLAEARRPEVAAILLDQGPKVLGWARARELEDSYSRGLMKRSIKAAVAAGQLKVPSVDLTAHLLNTLLGEVALTTLHDGKAPGRQVAEATIRQFIMGLAKG